MNSKYVCNFVHRYEPPPSLLSADDQHHHYLPPRTTARMAPQEGRKTRADDVVVLCTAGYDHTIRFVFTSSLVRLLLARMLIPLCS